MNTPGSEATTVVPAAKSLIGQVVSGRYLIRELLGEGGMGAVYLAEHTHMRKRVALKLLHPEMSKDSEVLARFKREAETAAHVDHPNVAAATDFGQTEDGSFFLVLEYVEGASLREAMASGPIAPGRALHIVRQISLGLERAHQAGIVHRDLKPENVMLVQKADDPDFVKVLDFGIAKVEPHAVREGGVQALTRLGTIIGTPEYMAPEQALGEPVSPAADLYAVGVILYEMLTARHPFRADDRMAILSMHIVAPVPPMSERNPEVQIPPAVEELARSLLEKDKNARPAGARALVEKIDIAAAQSNVSLPQLLTSRSFGRESTPDLSRSPAPPGSSRTSVNDVVPPSQRGPFSANDALAKTDYGIPASTPGLPTGISFQELLKGLSERAKGIAERAKVVAERAKDVPRPWLFAACGVVPLAVLVLVLTIVFSHRPRAQDEDAEGGIAAALGAPAPAPPTSASPERLNAAAAAGATALEGLAKEFPEDANVRRRLVATLIEGGRTSDALEAIRSLAKLDKTAVDDHIVDFVVNGTARLETADDAFALLEGPLGARGVDALIELSTNKTAPPIARNRASKSLSRPDVRANATPAAVVVIDLKGATTCAARRDWIDKAKDSGDGRCLAQLKALRNPRGCGFMGVRDCWPCLRKDDALDDAIRTVEARSPK